MKRRKFLQALLGTAAVAPLLPLLAREDDKVYGRVFIFDGPKMLMLFRGHGEIRLTGQPLGSHNNQMRGLPYYRYDTVAPAFQGLSGVPRVTEVDPVNKTFTVDTV